MVSILKKVAIFAFATTLIGAISASEAHRDPEKTHLITTRALILDEFSGLETQPIIKAFFSWMNETQGDILIVPPKESDGMFYDVIMKNEKGELQIFDFDLRADALNPNPWDKGCRSAFYVIRLTSNHPAVQAIDEARDSQVLAFTFTGCSFKFIVVVADRMKDSNMMYTTMLHELGHMWGLPDNKNGISSIMNGSYPGSMCITHKDIVDVYEKNGKKEAVPLGTGCGK